MFSVMLMGVYGYLLQLILYDKKYIFKPLHIQFLMDDGKVPLV